jgi:multisubunit Na+/H+ antiporter MnhE subunit
MCGIALFLFSRHFVSQEITPKWLGLIVGVAFSGYNFQFLTAKSLYPCKIAVFTDYCFMFVCLFQGLAVLGFNGRISNCRFSLT